MPAGMVWGASRHSRLIYKRLKGFSPGDVIRETPRKTDLERRFHAMTKQYGKTIAELVEVLGSPEAVGLALASGQLPPVDQWAVE